QRVAARRQRLGHVPADAALAAARHQCHLWLRHRSPPFRGHFTGLGGLRNFARKRYASARDSFANCVSIRLNAWPPGASLYTLGSNFSSAALSALMRCSASRTLTASSLVVVWINSGVWSFSAFHAGERRRYSLTSSSAVLPMWYGAENRSR